MNPAIEHASVIADLERKIIRDKLRISVGNTEGYSGVWSAWNTSMSFI